MGEWGARDGGDVLSRLRRDFEAGRLGWVGDWRDVTLGYLTFASTLLAHVPGPARPVGCAVLGPTSTGKTELANSLMRLFPDDHVVCVTSLSAKGLIYRCLEDPECLNGKVVFVEELSGLKNEDLQYMLRILVTRGEVRHVTVVGGKPVEVQARAKISLQTTGLPTDRLRSDTMNRLLVIKSDASEAMTGRVIAELRRGYAGAAGASRDDGEGDAAEWYQEFFERLVPRPVVIPFAERVVFDHARPENRRTAKIVLDLISTVTLLRQEERGAATGPVTATLADYETIYKLFVREEKGAQESMEGLRPNEAAVLGAVRAMATPERFTYEDLTALSPGAIQGEGGGYSLTALKYGVQGLTEKGYLRRLPKVGRRCFYALAEERSGINSNPLGLAPPERVAEATTTNAEPTRDGEVSSLIPTWPSDLRPVPL